MEIQGVWIPLDVLKYITQFLWVKDHREDFMRVCKVFHRALTESPPAPPVYVVPEYKLLEGGIVTTVDEVACYTKRFIVKAFVHPEGLVRFDTLTIEDMISVYDERIDQIIPGCFVRHVVLEDLPFFCTDTGSIGKHVQIRYADHKAIVRDMLWLYHFTRRHIGELYNQVNERKLLKHKRPRKRVKRFGF
jgi:hypothetical protein